MPMRTACGSAFVRRTARFDTGYRLHVFVAQRQRHQSEGLASVRSNRTEDTQDGMPDQESRPDSPGPNRNA
jgi:hypothetical protein